MKTVITIAGGNIQIADALSVIANQFAAGDHNVTNVKSVSIRDTQSNEIVGQLIVKP